MTHLSKIQLFPKWETLMAEKKKRKKKKKKKTQMNSAQVSTLNLLLAAGLFKND